MYTLTSYDVYVQRSTEAVKYLGMFDSVDECQEACLAYHGSDALSLIDYNKMI
jgi:hypothetical protein